MLLIEFDDNQPFTLGADVGEEISGILLSSILFTKQI
jgi:hypothetical protein